MAPISVFNYNGRRIIDGIPWEFVERLAEIGGAEEEKPLGNITFSPEKYKIIAQRMLLEAGVTLYFHSYLTGCRTEQGRITHIVVENKNGAEAIAAVTSSTPRATPIWRTRPACRCSPQARRCNPRR